MQLHEYRVHLYKDVRGQRQNVYIATFAESPEKAIQDVRFQLHRIGYPAAKWESEATQREAGAR
jgi:hypothetical protein